MEKLRIDKWLWCVRLYKSRTLSADACRNGKVHIQDQVLKPSHLIEVGAIIRVKKNGFNFIFKVEKIIKSRVGAPLAITCYSNLTPLSELQKYKDWFYVRKGSEFRTPGTGRPTKKENRVIQEFKLDYLEEE